MIGIIKELISLFSGEKPAQHPFVFDKTTVKAVTKQDDNIRYSSGQAFVQRDTADGFEADRFTGKSGQRTATMTQADHDIIEASKTLATHKRLNIVKYNELKIHWSNNRTIHSTTVIYKGKKGFSKRTIEKYFAAMSKANTAAKDPILNGASA